MVRKKKKEEKKEILKHVLIPHHEVCNEEEKKEIYERYHASIWEMPKIKINDPGIRHLKVKPGDIIKIKREKGIYYRVVINE